jgi:hypothetical protein
MVRAIDMEELRDKIAAEKATQEASAGGAAAS